MNWISASDPFLSLAIGLTLTIVTYLLQPRVRIVWTVSHGFIHHLKGKDFSKRQSQKEKETNPNPGDMQLWAQSLLVMNRGRAVAENVEIVLNHKPLGMTIWPQRQYTEAQNPDDKFVLHFDDLASQESVSLQMIDVQPLPLVFNVRCKTKVGREVASQSQILYPKWLLTSVWLMIVIGALSVFSLLAYASITTLRWGGIL
jgi:hypothetical protein